MNKLIKRSLTAIFLTYVTVLNLSGCSVFMAAQSGGVDANTLGACHTRNCLICRGAVPISCVKNSCGILCSETFEACKPTGSVARAAMHGVLDVATFGLWEVAGTPIEAVENKKEKYIVKVYYENDGETIRKTELLLN